jgi:Asp-tRNA(Asn)/Glu-tRNA(Gln) amidotransferase A subunit family amidase
VEAEALAASDAADAAVRRGEAHGPLHGVPVTIDEAKSTSSAARRTTPCPPSATT